MPQFFIDESGSSPAYEALDDFAKGYIECVFFTNQCNGADFTIENWWSDEAQADIREGRADGCLPSDITTGHLHPTTIERVAKRCAKWQADHADLLALAYEAGYSEAQAGRDLFYTQEGHGVGFSDRDELDCDPDDNGETLADRLDKAAGDHESHIWFGDHVENGNEPWVYIE